MEEVEQQRPMSKLAVTSFVLSLGGIIPIVLAMINPILLALKPELLSLYGRFYSFELAAFLSPTLLPAAVLISLISLRLIKKRNLGGKRLAISALVISIIGLLIIWWFLANLDMRVF